MLRSAPVAPLRHFGAEFLLRAPEQLGRGAKQMLLLRAREARVVRASQRKSEQVRGSQRKAEEVWGSQGRQGKSGEVWGNQGKSEEVFKIPVPSSMAKVATR